MIGEVMKLAGRTVPVSGKVISEREVAYMQQAAGEAWLTGGHFEEEFANALRQYLGVRHTSLCNSGSSANLLALAALTSPQIPGERRLEPGDGVIVATTSFPTTVAPIYQYRLLPIFVDVGIASYNIIPAQLEGTLKYRPKAIMIAHTLGFPFNVDEVLKFCARNGIWLIEDNCDALGSEWNGKKTGSFGVYSTQSFYPAHHITTGEGGAVSSYNGRYKRILESFRDWGRDCWCRPGSDDTCGRRFDQQFEGLPVGYDHKYIYSHIGYNLKMTEMQAACGLAQMERIEQFTINRRNYFNYLHGLFRSYDLSEFFYLPYTLPKADPSPFGYPLGVRKDAPFSASSMIKYLEENGIATRRVFAGNIIRQPAFAARPYADVEGFANADFIMENSFWVGCWHGLSVGDVSYIAERIIRFVEFYR
jgi:CDP-6-deoxy-D-xylo-4-hexulose-3-dehydrase